MKRSRLLGVLLTAAMLFGAAALWRARPVSRTPGAAAPVRGGRIVASIGTEPRSFNHIAYGDRESGAIALLTQGTLLRINRATFELEPWLAERWESSADGRTHTLHLRDVSWSDGTRFTAADVLFSLKAAFDPRSASPVRTTLTIGGRPLQATAPDPHTVVLTFPGPSGPGLRLLDKLVILPRHKLAAALNAGTFRDAWSSKTPPSDIVGTGPFVLREYQPGQRMVLDRNPRYWRKAPDGGPLPYLDRIDLEMVPDRKAEWMRLESGALDLPQSALGPYDYVTVRRAEEEGRLKVTELGVSTGADAFWFCLKPEVKRGDPRFAFVQQPEFRQAISHAVDREAFAQTVYLAAAVPIWGPVTPGNRPWFWPGVPRYRPDLARARELLKGIGLEDRNGNGVVEDAKGTEARFTVITERGIEVYARATAVLRDDLTKVGIALDIAPIESGALNQRLLACDYDAIYYQPPDKDLDPAANLDMWLSAGPAHVWNIGQKAPATEWERRIDTLMLEQAASTDPERRRDQFNLVQRIFAENLPMLYFAAPRLYYAHSLRVIGITPSVIGTPVLWSADTISVARAP